MLAAPDMEPPLGFEVRLFERMGVTDVAPRRRRRLRPSRWVPAVVGVAAAAVALGLGLERDVVVPDAATVATAQAVTRVGSGDDGGPGVERRDGRACHDLRRRQAVDVDDAR